MRKEALKKVLAVMSLILTGATTAMAQSDDEQVLVFRNTGEINLLYTSEIDSIVCLLINDVYYIADI